MHPVFVAAVKSNQVGVAPQQACSSPRRPAPSRRPCGRRASPNSPDAPVMARPAAGPGRQARAATELRDRRARAGARQPRRQSGSFFGSLFSSKPAENKPAETAKQKPPASLDRMATHGGPAQIRDRQRRSRDSRSRKPKPQPATGTASHGAIRPKPAEAAEPAEPQRRPRPRRRSPQRSASQPRPGAAAAMSGARAGGAGRHASTAAGRQPSR